MSATTKRKHIDIITPIKETSSELGSLVKVDADVLKSITEGDDSPEYVVVEFEECKSGNNVTYDREFFVSLAEQINTKMPPGYLGHKHFQGLDKEDLLPDPQVVWLGATVDTSGSKAKMIAKGYLLPASEGGKARAWIKRRAVNSVSWSADAVLTLGKDGSYRVKEFFLESIDFARKNREGVKNQRLTVVTEMEGSEKGVDEDDVKGIVGKLTFHELKEYNPGLVSVIKEQTRDEVKDETTTAVAAKETELEEKHKKEMSEVPEISLMQKIRDILGIKEDDTSTDPASAIATLLERLDDMGKKLVKDWFKNEILDKKIPNEKARALVGRLIPITEMAGDYRTEKGIEKVKSELESKADDLLDNDEDIQTVIKEMGARRGGPNFSKNNGRQNDSEDRDDNNSDDNRTDLKEMEKRGNVRVERVKVGI